MTRERIEGCRWAPLLSGIWIAAAMLAALPAAAEAQDLNAEGLADACTSCHGVEGYSQGYIPSLGGLDKATIVLKLKEFRDHKGDATIMNRIARGYTDAEFDALATYFSSVKKP